jgi:hypothetical protein
LLGSLIGKPSEVRELITVTADVTSRRKAKNPT